MTGTVKWFTDEKGYGFITPDQPIEGLPAGRDLFVHYRSIVPPYQGARRSFDEGDRVEFEVEQGRRGLQAGNARAIPKS